MKIFLYNETLEAFYGVWNSRLTDHESVAIPASPRRLYSLQHYDFTPPRFVLFRLYTHKLKYVLHNPVLFLKFLLSIF